MWYSNLEKVNAAARAHNETQARKAAKQNNMGRPAQLKVVYDVFSKEFSEKYLKAVTEGGSTSLVIPKDRFPDLMEWVAAIQVVLSNNVDI